MFKKEKPHYILLTYLLIGIVVLSVLISPFLYREINIGDAVNVKLHDDYMGRCSKYGRVIDRQQLIETYIYKVKFKIKSDTYCPKTLWLRRNRVFIK